MAEIDLDTYDPVLYMKTLGLLDDDVTVQTYNSFINKMKGKLEGIDARIADYVENQSESFIDLSDKIGKLGQLVNDMSGTEEKFCDYIQSGLKNNEEIFAKVKYEYNQKVSNIDQKKKSKEELQDVLYISKAVRVLHDQLDKLSADEVVLYYSTSDCVKSGKERNLGSEGDEGNSLNSNFDRNMNSLSKLHKKTQRLRDRKDHNESYLYSIDRIIQESEDVTKRFCHILIKELRELIKSSSFFSSDPKISISLKDSRKVFMILKAFKNLPNCQEYIYRTINNEIIEPELTRLTQQALKSTPSFSFYNKTSSSGDKDFDKSKLPCTIFIQGVSDLVFKGSLKNLVRMCHQTHKGRYRPLSAEVFISGYDIIQNCILDPIQQIFGDKLSFIYSSGISVIFHSNYTSFKQFIKDLVQMGVKDEKNTIKEMMSKFNLQIYFTLVAREIIKTYQDQLKQEFAKGKIEAGENCVSAIVINNIEKLIGEDLFLPEVHDKIIFLCFQIVIKVIQTTKDTLNAKSMSAENLVRILDEITKVEQYLNHDFFDNLIMRLSIESEKTASELTEAVSGQYRELFDTLSSRFDSLNQPCIVAASEKITKRLAENMEKFSQIAGIYRLTNRKAPDTPSEYTELTFNPVKSLTEKEFFSNLSPRLKSLLLDSIFKSSLLYLHKVLSKMLASVTKMNRNFPSSTNPPEEETKTSLLSTNPPNPLYKFMKEGVKNTDYDNICTQIYLDIKELEDQIDELGGSREYEELQNLYSLVPGVIL
ncbi:unnamed protein product [Moneuplotes crassus]|uniref:COG complex component COG2 C-terminal domain-containing protein n=1 Tax=Euplotes crassus TaxID=5936 RepID=A0AAD2DB74_EUPCR|nr:unnamed protein product [Moneuplotes crassus]